MESPRVVLLASLVAGTTAVQADLLLSVADQTGTQLNGFGPFNSSALVQATPSGEARGIYYALAAGDLDAFHILPNGNYLMSSRINGSTGSMLFDRTSLIEYDPRTGNILGRYLGVGDNTFTNLAENVDAATTDEFGNLFFSTSTEAVVRHAGGNLPIEDGDIVRLDAVSGVATVFLAETELWDDGDADVNGLHWVGDGSFLITTDANELLGGALFRDGDIFRYTPSSGAASIVFSEENFNDGINEHDIDALCLVVPSPWTTAAPGLLLLGLGRRRR